MDVRWPSLSQEPSADKTVSAAAEWPRTVTWPLARGGTPSSNAVTSGSGWQTMGCCYSAFGFMRSHILHFPPCLCRSLGRDWIHFRTPALFSPPALPRPLWLPHPVLLPLRASSPLPLPSPFRRGCSWRGGALSGGNICRHNFEKKNGIWGPFAWIAQLFQPIHLKTNFL